MLKTHKQGHHAGSVVLTKSAFHIFKRNLLWRCLRRFNELLPNNSRFINLQGTTNRSTRDSIVAPIAAWTYSRLTIASTSTNKWINECINEWMNERMNEWMNEPTRVLRSSAHQRLAVTKGVRTAFASCAGSCASPEIWNRPDVIDTYMSNSVACFTSHLKMYLSKQSFSK